MESIGKKQLRKLACPKCGKTKLRLTHATDSVGPDGGTGPERSIRCDACKNDFVESNAALQTQWRTLRSEMTPPPISVRR